MHKSLMLSLPVALVGALVSMPVLANGPDCGAAQDDTWMTPEVLTTKIEGMGYTIENMAISDGNCYEMSGMNTQGFPVTAYIDPKTGDLLQEDVVQ